MPLRSHTAKVRGFGFCPLSPLAGPAPISARCSPLADRRPQPSASRGLHQGQRGADGSSSLEQPPGSLLRHGETEAAQGDERCRYRRWRPAHLCSACTVLCPPLRSSRPAPGGSPRSCGLCRFLGAASCTRGEPLTARARPGFATAMPQGPRALRPQPHRQLRKPTQRRRLHRAGCQHPGLRSVPAPKQDGVTCQQCPLRPAGSGDRDEAKSCGGDELPHVAVAWERCQHSSPPCPTSPGPGGVLPQPLCS